VAVPLFATSLAPYMDRITERLTDVARSGRYILGPEVEAFEAEFADFCGARHCVGVGNGTDALTISLRAVGVEIGDEVVVPSFTFYASAEAIANMGAKPVFCDIDPVTFNIDPEAVAAAVTDATAGILPVHIFGYPADLPALSKVASGGGLGILEDAAQALGAVDRNGKKVGASGNLAVFAFYANKQMTTGEGGVLITSDREVAERVVSERNQGRAPNPNEVEHDRMGFNYRLSDLQAAIGIAQVERLDELLNARDNVAALYRERLTQLGAAPAGEDENHDIVLPCENSGDERRGWFVFVVQLPNETDRNAVISSLDAQGIASKAYLPCIHLLPPYRERFGFTGGEFPVAERVSERSLALPFFTSMSEGQVDRVCTALGEALGKRP
jgi:perosamine synthetase